MLKIAYLSGAYKNAGDYLIEQRAVELLRYVYPEAELVRILRRDVAEHIEEINRCDRALIGGGPVFQQSLRNYMPLELYTSEIRIPTMILGGGWYGDSGSSSAVRKYRFDAPTRRFLEAVYGSGFGFSCRDVHTLTVLKANGFPKTVMTGCPAWYDVRFVGRDSFRSESREIRRICVSDPARPCNTESALALVDYLREAFPRAEIRFLFHRGMERDALTAEKWAEPLRRCAAQLREKGVAVRDISYGAEGFSAYDDCDLHIGFRVHAHLYNLSIRNRSVLIEEDGRGGGANETLGLPSLRAYDDGWRDKDRRLKRTLYGDGRYKKPNPALIEELDSYLTLLEATDYTYITNAFRLQNRCFDSMLCYIRQLTEGKGE